MFDESPTVETIARIGHAYRRFGTTGFLPTLISDDLAVIDAAMRKIVDTPELPLPVAIALASTSLAPFLGLSGERGRIARGLAAELVLLDGGLRVRETWIAGVVAGGQA